MLPVERSQREAVQTPAGIGLNCPFSNYVKRSVLWVNIRNVEEIYLAKGRPAEKHHWGPPLCGPGGLPAWVAQMCLQPHSRNGCTQTRTSSGA